MQRGYDANKPGLEDQYFLAREEEARKRRRAKLEAKARAAAERERIAEQVGITDAQIAARIHELGLDGQTASILHLIPLVEVAWADGTVSDKERHAILAAAAARGIEPHREAGVALAALLEKRPSIELLDQYLDVLKALLHAKGLHPKSLLDLCVDVAAASGGFLGLTSRVSPAERNEIERIAAAFGDEAKRALADKLS
jgi:hypothetical protein